MLRCIWLATGLALIAAACDRGHPRERASGPAALRGSSQGMEGAPGTADLPGGAEGAMAAASPAPAAPAPGPASACKLVPLPLRRPMPKRLVAIGDIHGDLAGARAALRTAGAIDAQDRWIGGDLVVVQTGDILDRGDDEQAIFDLIARLEREAEVAGGAFIMLLGNHELMNAAGDFRYVTPGALRDFDDAPGVDPSRYAQLREDVRGRVAALTPGGSYAQWLAGHNVVVIVGDTVFAHAGVVGDWVSQIEEANRSVRCWLYGQEGGIEDPPLVLRSDVSPVWTRALGFDSGDCDAAKAALAALGAQRMVVGHTVQRQINGVCGDTVWRIDVGLGKHYGGPIQVLELVPGRPPKVLTGGR